MARITNNSWLQIILRSHQCSRTRPLAFKHYKNNPTKQQLSLLSAGIKLQIGSHFAVNEIRRMKKSFIQNDCRELSWLFTRRPLSKKKKLLDLCTISAIFAIPAKEPIMSVLSISAMTRERLQSGKKK